MDDICQQRLRNQHLASQTLKDPVEVLKSLVAIQGQDYAGAKWALAQRTKSCTNDQVEQALTDGRILRLHVMRPTWHFVPADDIRWLVELTAPRVRAACNSYFRKAGLDDKFLRRTNKVIAKVLLGGNQLTRAELRDAVMTAAIEPGDSTRFGHILLHAELDGLICSGARKGNQFTYALLAERAPRSRILERDEALGELTSRYFSTRGPATVHDFVWWSGLKIADARRGIEIIGCRLKSKSINERQYWFSAKEAPSKQSLARRVHMLPLYDEYFIAYKDRSAAVHPDANSLQGKTSFVFDPPMVMDGRSVGVWERALGRSSVKIKLQPFIRLKSRDKEDFREAAASYAEFLGKDLELLSDTG
ncbi:MAG TPA: winged helix DNA-binding domain-containing protein [Pyrinomonadaceae bacterium]|jgi:hypothetical protein